jgi:hypothetical protein
LLANGEIDRGADCEEDRARFQKTNIHEKQIRIGELVTVWEPDEQTGRPNPYTLEISFVKPMV